MCPLFYQTWLANRNKRIKKTAKMQSFFAFKKRYAISRGIADRIVNIADRKYNIADKIVNTADKTINIADKSSYIASSKDFLI